MDQVNVAPADQLQSITEALGATLNPRVTNEIRQQALKHLENVKKEPNAPLFGHNLAADRTQNDAIRYYGLQLLEHAIRYRWITYSHDQASQLSNWVKILAADIKSTDALYLRNKIAQLWVELAKRSWADEWMDMDKSLIEMWNVSTPEKSTVMRVFVLYILETLSEDIINNEDAVAGLRLEVLGNALNEIMVPTAMYVDRADGSKPHSELRSEGEGWLARICSFFADCIKQIRMSSSRDQIVNLLFCATKAVNALRPTMSWISIRAVVSVNCIDCLFLPFYIEDFGLQIAATEVMYVLLVRPYQTAWQGATALIVEQCLRTDHVQLLREAYMRAQSSPGEDDSKYTLQKKMSEVLSLLADILAAHPNLIDEKMDTMPFFGFLTAVLSSNSLVVSIPVLHSWSRIMNAHSPIITAVVHGALAPLLQTCSTHLLRYEALSEDDESDIVQFLYDDFDTMPERHAFLGNYRRYCVNIIQSIARQKPLEALAHVMNQLSALLDTGQYAVGKGFDPSTYSKTSLPVLRFDAQFSVVTSALKGFSAWCADFSGSTQAQPDTEKSKQDMRSAAGFLQQWSHGIMNVHVNDPEVAAQVLQILVMVLKTIKASPEFVLGVVQHLLTMRLYDKPEHATFSDSVKTFESLRVIELQKLALGFPNELLEVYQDLEPRIDVLAQKYSDEPRLEWGYRAFLFMIIHRAAGLDAQIRLDRLKQMLSPIHRAWQDDSLASITSSFSAFCNALDLADLADFYQAHHFCQFQDWSSRQLDRSGQAKQASIKARGDSLPLRMTKCMLAASTEKLKTDTDEAIIAASLWSDLVPIILPSLLSLLKYGQAFHNMTNWSALPNEVQTALKRTMQDRFWQSGISNESKDEFYARVSGSKLSYEGFASVVRGTVRNVREQGYHIVYLLTKFDEQFYGLEGLPEMLADALFSDAEHLPANHLHPVINLTTGLVQRCPARHRARFLPPILTRFFSKLDVKISSEWEAIASMGEQNTVDVELSDEMRVESVLRQLTYSMVSFVPFLLEYDRHSSHASNEQSTSPLHELILTDDAILVPMMLFCTHALRMRDTRCCTTICRVFRNIIPIFAHKDGSMETQVREFVSTEVLKACITSLNEPYFADMQKDLAALITQIVRLFITKTSTPRDVLLSLPDLSTERVDAVVQKVCKSSSERQQRALMLELLEGVRGVSIHEVGKIVLDRPKKGGRNGDLKSSKYMDIERAPVIVDGTESGLDSVADLFGNE